MHNNSQSFYKPGIPCRALSILQALDKNQDTTQKALAAQTEMSGAMINQYIKNMQEKGWISMQATNGKKYAYQLTALGQQEQQRLRNAYLSELAGFFSALKQQVFQKLDSLGRRVNLLALFGASELSELLISALQSDTGYHVAALLDPDPEKQGLVQQRLIVAPPEMLQYLHVDALINCSGQAQSRVQEIMAQATGKRIQKIITL